MMVKKMIIVEYLNLNYCCHYCGCVLLNYCCRVGCRCHCHCYCHCYWLSCCCYYYSTVDLSSLGKVINHRPSVVSD